MEVETMASFLDKIFKTDKKEYKKVENVALLVDAYKEVMANLSDEELKAKTPYFKQLLQEGKTLDDILPEAFAVAREAAKRVIREYPYFVQVVGAVVLHRGDVAEMKTGEGKTLTSTMTVYLNALLGKGVHVVTVNEYLAQRDAEWMGAIYRFLGLSVGVNVRTLSPAEKKAQFLCDVTYTTNSEIGFDYLRDNMSVDPKGRVLRSLYMAIIDEADSILIDESRTPLIISGGYRQTANLYNVANRFAKSLTADKHYVVNQESKSAQLTEEGVAFAEKLFRIPNLYSIEHTALVHHIHQALKANFIFVRDVDYMVQDGQIVIIDQFTGRQLVGRTYSDGLHQAIEAKEGVKIKQETSVVATITYQNFFRLYEKLGGMTGTAKTEEEEFLETYNMRVVEIPTNKPIVRMDAPDLIYANKQYKFQALINEVKERHALGQPILIGTISVEMSEYLSDKLRKEGLRHEVLNAKNHEREAEIIKKAGEKFSITIATNMAGRGTDIKLGEGVREIGGLAVIGSERHEARRIDNQLRGRSGRQGDPGYSRFYVSLEDDLMLRFGNNLVKGMFAKMKDEPLESALVTRVIASAQSRVEGYNFDIRKDLIAYDDVLRQQREIMYKQRDAVIFSDDVHDIVADLFKKTATAMVESCSHVENKEMVVDLDKLYNQLTVRLLKKEQVSIDDIKAYHQQEVIDNTTKVLLTTFETNRLIWGEPVFKVVEKQILIRIIDINWTQHIDRMAKLREGIHLRAYAQTNPLQSYINEGFKMFQEMVQRIADEATNFCLHAQVSVERKPTPPPTNKK